LSLEKYALSFVA